jgi:uncharacterized membrane protein
VTSTGRLETFADGVFAIAITLLVLGIHLPEPHAALWDALRAQWPALLAYVISFLTIGIMWISHHQMFTVIGRSNMTFAFINVVFLMVVAFVPYPTQVLADRIGSGVDATGATLLYGGVMVGIAIMFNAIWAYAARGPGRLLRTDLDRRAIEEGARGYRYGPPGYVLITLLAFISPILSLAGFAAFAVYWVLPKSGSADTSADA